MVKRCHLLAKLTISVECGHAHRHNQQLQSAEELIDHTHNMLRNSLVVADIFYSFACYGFLLLFSLIRSSRQFFSHENFKCQVYRNKKNVDIIHIECNVHHKTSYAYYWKGGHDQQQLKNRGIVRELHNCKRQQKKKSY